MTSQLIPLNIDLQIDCKSEELYSTMVGGNPETNLKSINNIKFKCLKSIDGNYNFIYDNTNVYASEKSMYLGKGSFTVVMSIIQKSGMEELNNLNFVIRITDIHNNFDISKYIQDKQLINKYVPTAYYYGIIKCENNVKLNYVIVQKCQTFDKTNINKISFENKKKFLLDLVSCLDILQKNKYALYDLKIQNVGYVNDNQCVLIDYDKNTILPITQSSEVNTYYPTYIYINYLSFIDKYDPSTFLDILKVDKISISGLADIILNLFFVIEHNNNVTPASLTDLHYGGVYKSVNTKNTLNLHKFTNSEKKHWWTESFLNLVNGHKIKEYLSLLSSDDNWSNYQEELINILFNYDNYTGLLSPEYNKIPTFENIKIILSKFDTTSMIGGNAEKYKMKYKKYKSKCKKYLDLNQ